MLEIFIGYALNRKKYFTKFEKIGWLVFQFKKKQKKNWLTHVISDIIALKMSGTVAQINLNSNIKV